MNRPPNRRTGPGKPVTPAVYHRRLTRWYATHRRDLPWRKTRDPYAIAVSEVMLQQTQVDRVIPKYEAWLNAFPTTESLARAPLSRVLKLWSGLGYNRRSKMLRAAARVVMTEHDGVWPREVDELQKLPGFGPYTAGAVAVFAFRQPVTMIDTNVRRVLSRWRVGTKVVSAKDMSRLASEMLPLSEPDVWHHALMDFGATVCQSRPKCAACPFRDICAAYPAILTASPRTKKKQPKFVETNRFVRGRIMAAILSTRPSLAALQATLAREHQVTADRFRLAVKQLKVEGLIVVRGGRVQAAR